MNEHDEDRHVGVAPAIAAFGALILFGLAVRYWQWVAAFVAIATVFVGLLWLSFWLARRVDRRHAERAAVCARADEQHAQVMAGDERGIYGIYPPAV